MGAAMEEVIADAFEKDMNKRPVSILVLTAGRPEDAEELTSTLEKTASRVAGEFDSNPLSITFVQIGDHPKAAEYLASLDGQMEDLVDTIKDDEIQAAMGEIKGTKSSGLTGGLIAGCKCALPDGAR